MIDELKNMGVQIAKDGIWQVPPENRPDNWREMGLKEPENPIVVELAVEVVPDVPPQSSVAVTVSQPSPLPSASVTAKSLDEIPHMQASLAEWCRVKLSKVKQEAIELREAVTEALKHKWKASTLKTHASLAEKRVIYYEKILSALDAGYCLFPTVDCEIFAIRTDRNPRWQAPQYVTLASRQRPSFDPEEPRKNLPQGQGEYVNPVPESKIKYVRVKKDDYSQDVVDGYQYTVDDWKDVEFPVVMSKAHIMDATGKALALKVFDEIGIITDHQRRAANVATPPTKGDPIIVGRILNPKPNKAARSFLIAWHVDVDEDI